MAKPDRIRIIGYIFHNVSKNQYEVRENGQMEVF